MKHFAISNQLPNIYFETKKLFWLFSFFYRYIVLIKIIHVKVGSDIENIAWLMSRMNLFFMVDKNPASLELTNAGITTQTLSF